MKLALERFFQRNARFFSNLTLAEKKELEKELDRFWHNAYTLGARRGQAQATTGSVPVAADVPEPTNYTGESTLVRS